MARKKRYTKVTAADLKKSLDGKETPEKLRAEFPKELVLAFVDFHNTNCSDEAYIKYAKFAEKFLGELFKDRIEQSKLVVRLTIATFDLVNNDEKNKVEKEKVKKNKKLAGS